MSFKLLQIITTAAGASSLHVLPGSFDGVAAARESIDEPGEYFLINSFKIDTNGIKKHSTDENNSQGKTDPESSSKNDLESSSAAGEQTIQAGDTGKTSKKISSPKKKAAAKKNSK